jgi:hypothetical protein
VLGHPVVVKVLGKLERCPPVFAPESGHREFANKMAEDADLALYDSGIMTVNSHLSIAV